MYPRPKQQQRSVGLGAVALGSPLGLVVRPDTVTTFAFDDIFWHFFCTLAILFHPFLAVTLFYDVLFV